MGEMMNITKTADNRWQLTFRYKKAAIEELKSSIIWREREWDKSSKAWIITPNSTNERALKRIAARYFGVTDLQFPAALPTAEVPFSEMFTIQYIGAPKDFDGVKSSSALLMNGDWHIVFPEDVLKSWFIYGYTPEKRKPNSADETLYSVLGTKQSATGSEIKRAYRIASKTWHPDVNDDPAANDMFIKIKEAYDKLSNPKLRARYDAGLQLQQAAPRQRKQRSRRNDNFWKPPIRCGRIACSGKKIGRFYYVETIFSWDPVTDARGRMMASSWKFGDDKPTISWI